MFTLRAQSVSPHHDGVAHQTSLRSRRTMMNRANSLHMREAGSLISLPVTHDHDPRKHPRTGATVMTAVVGYDGRTRDLIAQHNPEPDPQLACCSHTGLAEALLLQLASIEASQ